MRLNFGNKCNLCVYICHFYIQVSQMIMKYIVKSEIHYSNMTFVLSFAVKVLSCLLYLKHNATVFLNAEHCNEL
jgi:hypothetical protein